MLKKCLIITIFTYFCLFTASAQHEADSLAQLLSQSTSDSMKVVLTEQLSKWYAKSDPAKSVSLAQEGLSIAQKAGFVRGEMICHNRIGIGYALQGNIEQAWEHFLEALLFSRQLNDKRTEASLLNNIGNLYSELYIFDKAEEALRQAEAIYREHKEWKLLANTLANLGGVLNSLNKDDLVLPCFHESVAIRKRENMYLGSVYNNTGEFYLKKTTRYDSALWYLEASLQDKTEHKQTVTLANTFSLLSLCYLRTQNSKLALHYAKQGLQYASSASAPTQLLSIGETLTEVYSHIGEYKEALRWADSTKVWREATQSRNAFLQLGNVQARVELKLKQKENEELRQMQASQENKIERMSDQMSFVLVLLVLLMLFSAIYYRAYRAKARAMGLLSQSYKEIESRNEEIATLNATLEESAQQKAQQLVERDATLRDYAYINSHQLRSALARLLGLVNVLQTPNASTPEELPFLLEHIKKAGEDLDRIVKEIAGRLNTDVPKE